MRWQRNRVNLSRGLEPRCKHVLGDGPTLCRSRSPILLGLLESHERLETSARGGLPSSFVDTSREPNLADSWSFAQLWGTSFCFSRQLQYMLLVQQQRWSAPLGLVIHQAALLIFVVLRESTRVLGMSQGYPTNKGFILLDPNEPMDSLLWMGEIRLHHRSETLE